MARIIEVTVSPKGDVSVQTKGYSGSDCLQASKFVEEALGVKLVDTRTAEFYAQPTISEQQVQQ